MDELRARLRRAEDDARAARYLAGGADRDTAELRSEVREFRAEFRGFRDQNNRVLSAMREDLTGLREHVDRGFAQANDNFLALRGQLDGVATFLRIVADRLPDANGDDRPQG